LSTATRTVLFTDLADYTGRVSRSDREGLRRILADHEAIVRPIVESAGGRIVKNIGDSFLCVFDSASDALQAALSIFAECAGGEGPDLRIGLTTGDVEELDGDVFGSSVNTAARIIDLTPVGECWFGTGTRICMNETEIPWEAIGRFALKGIPEEHDCFRLVPHDRAWLPPRVAEAVETRCLVRLRPGQRLPRLPADPVILLEHFEPRSDELKSTLAKLPVLNPQAFYLAAHTMATGDRYDWLSAGHGLIVGTPEAIGAAISQVADATNTHSSDDIAVDLETTMMLTRPSQAAVDLVICGLALPAVPFSEIVASYSYDLLADGRWVTRASRAIARLIVDSSGVSVTALQGEISVDGAMLPTGTKTELFQTVLLSTPAGKFKFVPTNRYAGVILNDTDMRLALRLGQTGEMGRSPGSPGLAFPNRPGQDNIQWCSGQRAERARESGFTMDRVLAGRQQASIRYDGNKMRLEPLHGECPTYVMRDCKLGQVRKAAHIQFGDYVVAGTTVVAVRRPE
jgi:class 3 adenylate cyclase